MLPFFLWYFIISLLGLVTFPFAFRMLPGLPDRGYTLSRTLGLLIWGYSFWLLSSLGILGNDLGGQFFAIGILLILSWWGLRKNSINEIRVWLRQQKKLIFTVEILFLLSFGIFAFIRSANPEILGTEKPMELAFINSILRSPGMPPNDPWLSGYSISYYYFGYILVAMIARLAGTLGSVAFNLGISLVFSMAAVGSYGILFNLLSRQSSASIDPKNTKSLPKHQFAIRNSLLAPFFVLIVSNLGGFLHLLRIGGVFWQENEAGEQVSRLWSWLDMGRYASPPPTADPFPHWWWWQASRIVQDFDFNWANKGDVIDEFPFFSFLLGDLHPHVLAMPFAFLAIGLALNVILGGGAGRIRWFGIRFSLNFPTFLLAAVALGSLGFFNTWDFPFYVAIFAGAYVLREMYGQDHDARPISLGHILWQLIQLGFALGVTGVFLYLPFFVAFQSQAGGPLPNIIYVTRGVYTWIHFAPFLVPILVFLGYQWWKSSDRKALRGGIKLTLGLIISLLAVSILLALLISVLQIFESINPQAAVAGNAFLGSVAAPSWSALILEGLKRRLTTPGNLLTLFAIISLTFALFRPRRTPQNNPPPTFNRPPATLFVLLLTLIGALLVLAPEFVFLRDLFGYRINTIFKFYFQVWLLWGIVAAYGTVVLIQKLRGPGRYIFQASMVVLLLLSLTYPIMGVWSKTHGFKPTSGFTLDGTAHLDRGNPDENAAMDWLRAAPLGVVAEAVGGSYSAYARMAVNSGQPTVLGWDFHEMQWRGGTAEMGSRQADIELLYCTSDWSRADEILNQYNIRYIVVGAMERIAYDEGTAACPIGIIEGKFIRHLTPAFIQGGVTIYEVGE
jgi:YYY domain-containing protein